MLQNPGAHPRRKLACPARIESTAFSLKPRRNTTRFSRAFFCLAAIKAALELQDGRPLGALIAARQILSAGLLALAYRFVYDSEESRAFRSAQIVPKNSAASFTLTVKGAA